MIDDCVKSGQLQDVHHVQNVQQAFSRNVKAHSTRLGASFPPSEINWIDLPCVSVEPFNGRQEKGSDCEQTENVHTQCWQGWQCKLIAQRSMSDWQKEEPPSNVIATEVSVSIGTLPWLPVTATKDGRAGFRFKSDKRIIVAKPAVPKLVYRIAV